MAHKQRYYTIFIGIRTAVGFKNPSRRKSVQSVGALLESWSVRGVSRVGVFRVLRVLECWSVESVGVLERLECFEYYIWSVESVGFSKH